jgi:hypothetical protein
MEIPDFPKIESPADVPKAHAAILSAVAAGHLTAEEAKPLSDLLAAYITAFDVIDTAAEVAEIKRMQQKATQALTRHRITRAELVELRKHTPRPDLRPVVGVITRRIVHPDPERLGMRPLPIPPNTAMEDVMIAAAMADFRKDGKVRRLILDNPGATSGA